MAYESFAVRVFVLQVCLVAAGARRKHWLVLFYRFFVLVLAFVAYLKVTEFFKGVLLFLLVLGGFTES